MEYNKPYKITKNFYNPVVPLKIFQTWRTKDLPPKMKERVELLKRQNPKFQHYLFDDEDCREFIKTHFQKCVLDAYDALVPGAYKADLWRLCVLYIEGGIYMDIKFCCVNGFRLIELTENEHYVKDRVPPLSIYNALMVCRKGNPFLWKAIYRIVFNTTQKYYGTHALCPTGPIMLGKVIMNNNLQGKLNIDMFHYINGGYIVYKNRFVISTQYPEYKDERKNYYDRFDTKHYGDLWLERRVYK